MDFVGALERGVSKLLKGRADKVARNADSRAIAASTFRAVLDIGVEIGKENFALVFDAGRRYEIKQRTRPCGLSADLSKRAVYVDDIAAASPRMHGMSLGPADLAASRAMKTTRVGGGHPEYKVLADPDGSQPRAVYQQDLWHYTIARMVDACAANGLKAFYGPFGDFADAQACETQFRNAFLLGCAGAWTLHPSQIGIAKSVFSPDKNEVAFARKILDAMPDGAGAVMIDGKMQDDATWKQAKVIVDLARFVASRDPDLAAVYGF